MWLHGISSILGVLIGGILQALFDFHIAHKAINLLSYIPLKSDSKISGVWNHKWEVESNNFSHETDRHGQTKIKQFGNSCYAEFYSGGKAYALFGKIKGNYLFGEWYDLNDKLGYFGTFELLIKDGQIMTGKWLGHSKESMEIRCNDWIWKRIV